MKNWKCAYCGYINLATCETCGQGEEYGGKSYGCGKPRRDASKEFGLVIIGLFKGIPAYDSDLRNNPESQQHEDFIAGNYGHNGYPLALDKSSQNVV